MANKEQQLHELAKDLEREHQHWEALYQHGGSDPFWPDGFGLNLTRNHIISDRIQIQKLMEEFSEELSLFKPDLPQIWHKEVPPEVSNDYMARGDAIRTHAQEQLKLYYTDPNFMYLLEHGRDAYPKGMTLETKAAGLPYYGSVFVEKYGLAVEEDDLVSMRRLFREEYSVLAERWKELALQIRTYLDNEASISTPVQEVPKCAHGAEKPSTNTQAPSGETDPSASTQKPLEDLLKDATVRASAPVETSVKKEKTEQLTLF